MDGVYYLLMLIGVVWLCLWTLSENPNSRIRIWWPFDRRDEPAPGDQSKLPPWRRRG